MKFDEIEKTESNSYPRNNITRESASKSRKKRDKNRVLDIAVVGSIFSALAMVVMLMTSVVSMAMDGVLGEVFKSLL